MSVYIRRFTQDPGNTVLLQIESVDILDLQPPGAITGVGSGTVLVVGEFENGPFAPQFPATEVFSPNNFVATFGTLGYQYGATVGNNPCCRQRQADGAISPEFWNGNGFVQLNAKRFNRLLVCRVNTSVGAVTLTRLAYLTGAAGFSYLLANGQVLQLDTGSGPQSATFNATAASLTSVPNVALAGTVAVTNASANITFSVAQTLAQGTSIVFASQPGVAYVIQTAITASTTAVLTANYTGTTNAATTSTVAQYNPGLGGTLTLQYDAQPQFVVTFQSTDVTVAAIVARINQFAGFALAATTASGLFTLTGIVQGLSGQVQVVSGSAGVLAALGLTAGITLGTGNVGNILQVKPSEVASVVQAAVTNSKVETDPNGALRISNTAGANSFIVVGSGTTATALGFLAGAAATDRGEPILVSGAGTYNLGTTGTITIQLDLSLPSVTTTVTSGNTLAQTVAALNAAFTAAGQGAPVTADGTARFYIVGTTVGGTITVVGAGSAAVLTELGLAVGTTVGVPPPLGTFPAGTVVQVPSSTQFVTMQDVVFSAAGVSIGGVVQPVNATSWSVPIRHALDNGAGLGTGVTTVTQVTNPQAVGAFGVTNPLAITAALTDAQVDAQYALAIAATSSTSSVASQANIIFSARQSNSVRNALLNNAIQASANGCFGRMAILRTPLGTLEQTALSTSAAPGVGAYRADRVAYCWPQARTNVPLIALVGTAGGAGFTSDGNIDVGADGFLASIMSMLPPEENPGQTTQFTTGIVALESSPNAANLQIGDYTALKAAGICALRFDNGTAIFQSGVTSVNPATTPVLAPIKRRRMTDFIQDSIAVSMKNFGKQLQTFKRRRAIKQEITQFLNTLGGGGPGAASGSPNNPDAQRIQAYNVDDKKGNLDPNAVALGIWRIIVQVQLLADFQAIVLQTTIGETVQVTQL